MIDNLTRDEFEFCSVPQPGYFKLMFDEYELCVEPCMNGYDVAIYDKGQSLLEPKRCTDVKTSEKDWMRKATELALTFANEFYKKYKI